MTFKSRDFPLIAAAPDGEEGVYNLENQKIKEKAGGKTVKPETEINFRVNFSEL